MNKTLSILALAISLTTLVVVGINRGKTLSLDNSMSAEKAALEKRFRALEDKHAALEESHRLLLESSAATPETDKELATTSPEDLRVQLADLMERQKELEQVTGNLDKLGLIKSMEKEVQQAYDILMDESLPVWTRVKQADKLKSYGQFDAKAVKAMMNLWNGTDNTHEKAGVLHALEGMVGPELRDPILAALQDDLEQEKPSGRFRYMAIEALEPMLPDPAVEEWLNYLAENDPEPKIQGRAQKTLYAEDGR